MNLQCNFDSEYFDFQFLPTFLPFSYTLYPQSLVGNHTNGFFERKKYRTQRKDIYIFVKEKILSLRQIIVTVVREFQKYLLI